MQGVNFVRANLTSANLSNADMGETSLVRTNLQGANLAGTHLDDADLSEAHLEDADFLVAHLRKAIFFQARLNGARLGSARLEGANLSEAHLEGADLRGVWFDNKVELDSTMMNERTCLGDIRWGGVGNVDLSKLDWAKIARLGDEQNMTRRSSVDKYEDVMRAYRQMAAQLRAQGITEAADRFAYRAQIIQRRAFLRRFRMPQYFGSVFLDRISGYGYKPIRSLIAYVLVILAFAAAYLLNAQFAAPHLSSDEALVLSVSAFHGRGFFTTGISLSDALARLAAGEAIIGLLIEITFIATFTQRFFAR